MVSIYSEQLQVFSIVDSIYRQACESVGYVSSCCIVCITIRPFVTRLYMGAVTTMPDAVMCHACTSPYVKY